MPVKHSKYPIQITYDLTSYCNANCIHCYSSSREIEVFDSERRIVDKVIRELSSVKPLMLIVSGGEPLLSPYFGYFIRSLLDNLGPRFPVTVITSNSTGVLAEQSYLSLLSDINKKFFGTITIYFSIHHSDAKMQEYIMGFRGIRDRLLSAVELVRRFGLPFTIGMTPMKINFDDRDELLRFAIELGASGFNLSEFVPTGKGSHSMSLDLDKEQYKVMKFWVKRKEHELGILGFISHHPHYTIITRPDLWFNDLYVGCTAGIYDLGIRSNGDITPCPLMSYKLGNIMEESIIHIWNNHPLLIKFRNREVEGKCNDCPVRDKCGGCRCLAYAYTGNPISEDPKCPYDIEDFNRFFNMVGRYKETLFRTFIEYNNLINKLVDRIAERRHSTYLYLLPNPYNEFTDSEIIVLNRITRNYVTLEGSVSNLFLMLYKLGILNEDKALSISEICNIYNDKFGSPLSHRDLAELIGSLLAIIYEQ